VEIIRTAQRFTDERGTPRPFGEIIGQNLRRPERRARAATLAPVVRGLASTDRRQLGHFTDTAPVLEFLASEKLAALAELGTSCPDHFELRGEPLHPAVDGDVVNGDGRQASAAPCEGPAG
jgi:rhamnose utilization protein RhaD (predicted bifunctional aldolase and dehydrogenase)